MSQYYEWGDLSWTTHLSGQAISTGSSYTTNVIALDALAAVEVSIEADYAAGSPTQGLKVYILRELDGTNYQTIDDAPWGWEMPYAGGAERRGAVTIRGDEMGRFKILLSNASGVTVTVTVRYRTAVIGSA